MVKFMRLFGVLFFAMNLSAVANFDQDCNQDTDQSTITAGPCVHLRSPDLCINYPTGECFWDEADQRCENRYNAEDRCSLIDDIDSCLYSNFGCFWDHDDQRCERRE